MTVNDPKLMWANLSARPMFPFVVFMASLMLTDINLASINRIIGKLHGNISFSTVYENLENTINT